MMMMMMMMMMLSGVDINIMIPKFHEHEGRRMYARVSAGCATAVQYFQDCVLATLSTGNQLHILKTRHFIGMLKTSSNLL